MSTHCYHHELLVSAAAAAAATVPSEFPHHLLAVRPNGVAARRVEPPPEKDSFPYMWRAAALIFPPSAAVHASLQHKSWIHLLLLDPGRGCKLLTKEFDSAVRNNHI